MSSPPNITANSILSDFKDVAFIALGSNLPSTYGTPTKTLQRAMKSLQNLSRGPLLRSSTWLSDPIDCPENSPGFVNAVVGLYPREGESARGLLEKLLDLETAFGRKRSTVANEPRILDLDLISYGFQVIAQEALTIPHPRAYSRAFVLFPLAEIAPGFVLPGLDKSVGELAKNLRLTGLDRVKISSQV